MLLIGLESLHSPHQCLYGLCFRCSSVQNYFCRVNPLNASFFSIFTRPARRVLLTPDS